MDHVKNLRHPITAQIGGQTVELVTIGTLAHALGRTTWCVKYWERLGLLPPAPFIINMCDSRTRRRLYPADLVAQAGRLMEHEGWGRRLERDDWQNFATKMAATYGDVLAPLFPEGITQTGPFEIELI